MVTSISNNKVDQLALELSGAVARVFMLVWDSKLLKALEKSTMHLDWDLYMYLRYVDDGNFAGEEMPLGARLEGTKVKVKENPPLLIKLLHPKIFSSLVWSYTFTVITLFQPTSSDKTFAS